MKANIHPLISKRYSPVIFSDKEVGEEVLNRLFEAARWAPSSFNDQPWSFIYGVKGKDEIYNLLFDCLMDANKEWAKGAPVLMLSVASLISPTTQKENPYAFHDTGMAVSNLLFQATDMDLYVHQMGGYSKSKARELLKIPDSYKPVAMIALGYKGNQDNAPEKLVSRENNERTRKPLNSFVFNDKFQG
jgi:nitroreductase